jgi:HlyD family secretion protein
VSQQTLVQAWAEVATAQANLAKLEAGPSEEDQKVAELKLKQAEAAVERARRDLSRATLVSPCACVVLEVKVAEGDSVQAGAGLILISDPTAVEARVTVVEEDLPLVRAGQAVDLFFDAAPDAAVTGHVARIVPQRTEGDRPLYPVYIALDEVPEGLAPGMTLDASIVIAQQTDTLRLPRAVVRARSDGTALVKVWVGDHVEERTVKIGLRGDLYVEILEGLREGDEVVSE